MQYEKLNEMINFIEQNLEEKISYRKLSRIIGVSEYSLQRIFIFLTGISITEYIRNRRLTKSAEELIITNQRMIDIAIKYQYDSPISFSRAFKKMHGINPSSLRKTKVGAKFYPRLSFNKISPNDRVINYRIKESPELKLSYISCSLKLPNVNEMILKLWDDFHNSELQEIRDNGEVYGISLKDKYCIGVLKNIDGLEQLTIPLSKWIVFDVDSTEQKEILEQRKFIFAKWLKQTAYNTTEIPDLEYYKGDKCEIWISIK